MTEAAAITDTPARGTADYLLHAEIAGVPSMEECRALVADWPQPPEDVARRVGSLLDLGGQA